MTDPENPDYITVTTYFPGTDKEVHTITMMHYSREGDSYMPYKVLAKRTKTARQTVQDEAKKTAASCGLEYRQ
jgi:hypothetical protein